MNKFLYLKFVLLIKVHAEIAQNRADLTYAFKIMSPDPQTLSLTVRNFKRSQATPLCRERANNLKLFDFKCHLRFVS